MVLANHVAVAEQQGDAEHADKKQRCDRGAITKVENGTGKVYSDTNAMPRAGNPPRVLHVGLTDGELAQRVIVVGHPTRAEMLSSFLTPEDPDGTMFFLASDRGFTTRTGLFEGVRVSVVAIGMGLAMMDFFVREARAVVQGPMAVIRLGTCGLLQDSLPAGTVSVSSEGSVLVQRNPDAFGHDGEPKGGDHAPYFISSVCPADAELSEAALKALRARLGEGSVFGGINATADSFYASQGRRDAEFHDANSGVIEELRKRHPDILSMEMETFQLLHLARCCRPQGNLRAAAAMVNVANRITGDVATGEAVHAAERAAGEALFRALAGLELRAK